MSITDVIALFMLVLTVISLGIQIKKKPPPEPSEKRQFHPSMVDRLPV